MGYYLFFKKYQSLFFKAEKPHYIYKDSVFMNLKKEL